MYSLLGIHGWQDNCATFDTLAPLLSPSVGLLSIDCPGHGMSSHFPLGHGYEGYGVDIVRRIADYFKWDKVSILGHSMGANYGFMYASLFPDDVELLIQIDCAKPPSITSKLVKKAGSISDKFLRVNEKLGKTEPPSYTYDALVELLYKGSFESPSRESCKVLLKRGMLKSPNADDMYHFSRDPRLRVPTISLFSHDMYMVLASRITSAFLNIRANPGLKFEKPEYYYETLHVIKKSARIFEFHEVEGTHHVHINNPERVAPIINNFLENLEVESRD